MAPPRGSAAYKKKDGTLALSRDSQSVSWTPTAPPGSKPAVTLSVSSITNLQQTPATSSKVMLKIFALPPGISEPETHVFSFTSATTARVEADAIKDALSKTIQAAKTGTATLAAPGGAGGGSGTSAAMAIASAVSSVPGASTSSDAWYDDERLKSDVELQQSLLKANLSLSRTFMESLRTKPESISNSQFTSQFWSSRIHILRAHAIERSQIKGQYNVLSSIKPRSVDNALRLNVSKEQIQLIFSQHSLVKRVYDENVPKLSEEAFWSRFFQSRLFKKLKGERISEDDPSDAVLDRYLQQDDEEERAKRLTAAHIPHIIDIEGNEENHSQRKGNQADFDMRPKPADQVPIFRTLNSLSEKIMSHVTPNDVDPSEPIGMDEATFNSLALKDLQGDAEENRLILNIKDQTRFFSGSNENDDGLSSDARLYAKQNPAKVLQSLQKGLASSISPNFSLGTAIGVDDDDSSSDESQQEKSSHVGSKASRSAATAQIFSAITQHQSQQDDISPASTSGFSTVQTSSTSGLPSTIFDRISLTHATTTEFLHHFWLAFLSGDPNRAEEIARLVETLDRAMDRVRAVADDAEAERMKEIDKMKKHVRDHYERTGKKLRFDTEAVKGGRKVVDQLLAPTVNSVRTATEQYGKALTEEGAAET